MTASMLSVPLQPQAQEHILLVCPPVFSYHLSIKSELESLGHRVTWWNDRGSNSTPWKIGLRLMPNLFAALLTTSFLKKLRLLQSLPVTRILVVKGEGMSLKALEALRRQLPGARFSLYFWDSVD